MRITFRRTEVFLAACAVLVNNPLKAYAGYLRLEGAQRRIVATDNFFLLLCDDAFTSEGPALEHSEGSLGDAVWYVKPTKLLRKNSRGPITIDLGAGLIRADGQVVEASCLSGDKAPHYPEQYESALYDPAQFGVCANMFTLDLKRALEIVSALDPEAHRWPWRITHDVAYELVHPGDQSLRVIAGQPPNKHPEFFLIDETKARLAKLHGVRS